MKTSKPVKLTREDKKIILKASKDLKKIGLKLKVKE
jgi:hypothetical protein